MPGSPTVLRVDSALDALVSPDSVVEKLAGDFQFTEGPVWFREGFLLFSDIPANTIYRWAPGEEVSAARKRSGYEGDAPPPGPLMGSNGLTRDHAGRLTIAEHGNARVARLEPDGGLTVLADNWQGQRLNSPNDLVYKSDGSLYFTDPPYGLTGQDNDPRKVLKFNGVYRLETDGTLRLLLQHHTRPNGLAFSPDEKYLYLSNSDHSQANWTRYKVDPDGSLVEGKMLFDVTGQAHEGAPDGLKVDRNGILFATGPRGVWVFTPEGKHLGTIHPPEIPANCAWGDDGQTLYITARTGLYRVRLNTSGKMP